MLMSRTRSGRDDEILKFLFGKLSYSKTDWIIDKLQKLFFCCFLVEHLNRLSLVTLVGSRICDLLLLGYVQTTDCDLELDANSASKSDFIARPIQLNGKSAA